MVGKVDWDVKRWMGDAAVSRCDARTRGIWFDLLCVMYDLDCSGELRGSPDGLARSARCTTVQLEDALQELKRERAANVEWRNGGVTVVCRSMRREFLAAREADKRRAGNALRVGRHREGAKGRGSCNGDVTGGVTGGEVVAALPPVPFKGLSLDKDRTIKLKPLSARAGGDGKRHERNRLTGVARVLALDFEAALPGQWEGPLAYDGGKWVNRIKVDAGKVERVLAEVVSAAKEGRIATTPGQYAEQIWKEFA